MKVCIIGGGAAGMMAALSAAEEGYTVTVLERQSRVGRKLLATGNGRCNLTNLGVSPAHYHGADPDFVRPALERFSVSDTLAFFRSLGLYTVEEADGKVYPLSDQANSVVDVLRSAMEQRGVNVVTGCDVLSLGHKARGWNVTTTGESYYADKLILTAGGCAGKALGGTRSGYRLLEMLGHETSALCPSLVQIKTDPTWVRSLKGVRADAAVTLKLGGKAADACAGEIQFTDFGLSGPTAFALSRTVSVSEQDALLLLDFLREYDEETVLSSLRERQARFPQMETEQLLLGMLNSRLGTVILKYAGAELHTPLAALEEEMLRKIAHTLKYFALPVQGVLGMEHAQVTAGGVYTAQFRADTLESRLAPGVYAAGEVLDIDGDCGGFNLQWAWSSGFVAGKLGKRDSL